MAKIINTKIDDGILIFTFTNNEDEVFSSFKLNPTDINVAARAEELKCLSKCIRKFLWKDNAVSLYAMLNT